MFGKPKQIARLLLKMFVPPFECRPSPRPSVSFRPRLEEFEPRVVPAGVEYTWTNEGGDGLFSNPDNWEEGGKPASAPPSGFADFLIFDGSVTSAPCVGMTGTYVSISIHNFSTIDLGGNVQTGLLDLQGGVIRNTANGQNITVTEELNWTAGTINASAYSGALNIDGSAALDGFAGATALIDPGGGTVMLGSHLNFENGATGTIHDGTIDTNKDGIQLITNTGSDLSIIPNSLQGIILGFQRRLQGVIMPGTTWTLDPGVTKVHGALGNGGTLTLLPDARLYLDGDAETEEGYVQWGGGKTYLHGTSRLVSSFQPVLIQGGTLATVWSPSVSSGTARIVASTVIITGGDIYVSIQPGPHLNFGELIIAGSLQWLGGTFHPYVYADGVTTDVLRQADEVTLGNFTINGGVIDPIYLDSDYGVSSFPHSGDSWIVLRAAGGFTSNTAPIVNNNLLWSMQIDPVPVGSKKFWRLIAN